MTVAPAPSAAVSPRATTWALTLLTAMNVLNYIDRQVLPAALSSVARDIPMRDTQKGMALSAFVWVYMLTAPVFGRLGDRASRRVLVAIGVALWSLATGAAALAGSFAALLLARSAVGVGEAAYATVAPSLIGDYYPAHKRGPAMAVFYLAIPVGGALGYVLGGQLSQDYGWRTAFLAVGLPGLALAAAVLTIRDPPRGQFDVGQSIAAPHLREALATLWRNRVYVWTVAGTTAYTFALGGLAQWMPTFLQRERGLTEKGSGQIFGACTVVAGLVGTAAGSALAERLRGRVRDADLMVCWTSTLAAVPFALLCFWLPQPRQFVPALFVAEVLLFMGTGPSNTVLLNRVPANVRATAFAVAIFAMHALGDAVSPTLMGVVSDATRLSTAMLLVPLAFVLAALCWFYIERTAPALAVAPSRGETRP